MMVIHKLLDSQRLQPVRHEQQVLRFVHVVEGREGVRGAPHYHSAKHAVRALETSLLEEELLIINNQYTIHVSYL